MATLTPNDYRELRRAVYTTGHGKEELKALPSLPNEPKLMAAFQAIENGIVAAAPQIKASMDAALGVTTSATLFRKIFRQWLRWRDRQGG
jgi:hypothetical protein